MKDISWQKGKIPTVYWYLKNVGKILLAWKQKQASNNAHKRSEHHTLSIWRVCFLTVTYTVLYFVNVCQGKTLQTVLLLKQDTCPNKQHDYSTKIDSNF